MDLVPSSSTSDYRTVLETGNILFFPQGGFDLPDDVRQGLLGAAQDARAFHKNIAYKTSLDKLSGLKTSGSEDAAEAERVHAAMRAYSTLALGFMSRILPDYAKAWKVDYASFRSIEERGRDLPLKKRNDLLHVDAFPTRPVFGDLILRCFTNVNPDQSREWLTSDPFPVLAEKEARHAGLAGFATSSDSGLGVMKRRALRTLRAAGLPVVDRSPYDSFMLHFHDWLKANESYQRDCPKYRFDLPPGSTWLVFTDVVPHAVLAGRLALEQTVIVSRSSLADRGRAPASILERMTGTTLA